MKVIALQNYTDQYISLFEGEIRDIEDVLAQFLIEKQIVGINFPDDIEVTQITSTGTEIATVQINGETTKLYAPQGGGEVSLFDSYEVCSGKIKDITAIEDGTLWVGIYSLNEEITFEMPYALKVMIIDGTQEEVFYVRGHLTGEDSSWYIDSNIFTTIHFEQSYDLTTGLPKFSIYYNSSTTPADNLQITIQLYQLTQEGRIMATASAAQYNEIFPVAKN